MAPLRVVIHLATGSAVLALAVAVGRWLRDPEPGGALVGILVLGAVVGLCAHRLYREGGLGRARNVARRSPPAETARNVARRSPLAETARNVARRSPLAVTGGRNRSHEDLASAEPPSPLWMNADLLDLNHASLRELQTLPGVGKVTAERIAAERPFDSVDDLARVGGLGPARIRAIAARARTS